MDDRLPDGPYFRIRLHGSDEVHPNLLSVATFLFDFTTLYELIRLAAESKEDFHRLARSRFALYRNAHRVRHEHKLFLERLRHESPLEIVAIFTATGAGVGAAWGLVQIVEKLWSMPLNIRKLRAEVEKLERENEEARAKISPAQEPGEPLATIQKLDEGHIVDTVRKLDEGHIVDTVLRRLDRSEVKITQADIDLVMDLTEIKRR